MEFRILGPLEAVRDAESLDLGRPKQRAVLAALLIHRGRVVSLDRLLDQLWGDEGHDRAVVSLRSYVSNLRRVLEPGRCRGGPFEVLVTQAPGYRLRVGPAAVDAARFESLATEGRRLLDDSRLHEADETLVEALALWRGPALAEFAFECFARAEVARLEELRAGTIEDRLATALGLGRHAGSIAELEALVADHPLRERLWALLMVALYRSGRQADALRAFAAARTMLADELGLEPGPALRQVEADILAQAPSLDWHRPHEPPPSPTGVGPPDFDEDLVAAPAPAPAPLVGRRNELARLVAALAEAGRGRGRLALISGEPGIGKTHLVEELARLAGDGDATVVWGRSQEAEGAPPYWPWAQVLNAVLASVDPNVVRRALDGVAGDLAQVVPEVKELEVDVVSPASLDPASARFAFHRAVVQFLRRTAESAPMMIVLDDIHWADTASLELLRYVAAETDTDAVFVIATYRDVDPGVSGTLADVLGSLARHRGLDRVRLEGLTEPEVGIFMARTAEVAPTPAAVTAVHARTEGNPFFVAELARLLISEGGFEEGSSRIATGVGVPVGVRDVVQRRLARLPEATNELLETAAVIGREFDLAVLARAGSGDEEVALDHLDLAITAGIVGEDATVVGRYAFSHALVCDTIYDGLSASRRARLHARVGRALETFGDPSGRVAELAAHFYRSCPVDGPGKGFAYAMRAARAAQAAFAYERAEDELRRALELVALMAPGDERAGRELEAQNALAALLVMTRGYGDPDVGRACARARELCEQVGETEQLFAALWASASFHSVRGDFGLVEEPGSQFLAIGRQHSSAQWLMAGSFSVGHAQFCTGRIVEAGESFAEARRLAPSIELSAEVADRFIEHPRVVITNYSSFVALLVGDRETAFALDEEARTLAERLSHPFTLAFALLSSTHLAVLADDAQLAQRRAEVGIAVCDEHGFPLLGEWIRMFHGWAVAEQGNYTEGMAEMLVPIRAHRSAGAGNLTQYLLGLAAGVEAGAGHVEAASALLADAFGALEAGEDRFFEAELWRIRGDLLAPVEPGQAEECLRRAVAVAHQQGATWFGLRAESSLARLVDARR